MEKINYKGWENCYRLFNDKIELVVTTDIGPRIIRFGFIGDTNELAEFPETLGKTGGDEWHLYGGHRLWHAPEEKPRSYQPDNEPVLIEQVDDLIQITQPTEEATGIQKELDIYISADQAHVRITHRLYNNSLWGVELAPWALTVMATGGKAIIPMPPRGSHESGDLLPTSSLTLWSYTDMADPRWTWGTKFIMLQQDSSSKKPQKIGARVPDGWAAYANHNHLFIKTFSFVPGVAYPDFGCSVETFTNDSMLELETLAPLYWLEPGEACEHEENWYLFDNVPMPEDEADVEANISPKIVSE